MDERKRSSLSEVVDTGGQWFDRKVYTKKKPLQIAFNAFEAGESGAGGSYLTQDLEELIQLDKCSKSI